MLFHYAVGVGLGVRKSVQSLDGRAKQRPHQRVFLLHVIRDQDHPAGLEQVPDLLDEDLLLPRRYLVE